MGSITNTTAARRYIKDYKLADTNQNSSPTGLLLTCLKSTKTSSTKQPDDESITMTV